MTGVLRDLVTALPRCRGLDAVGERCRRVATREYANAPGWTPACDDPAHVWRGACDVRDLPYAAPLRAVLAALNTTETTT